MNTGAMNADADPMTPGAANSGPARPGAASPSAANSGPARPGAADSGVADSGAAEAGAAKTFYAAAHVVADPAADNGPGKPAALDWDATMAFRHYLWSLGLGVADAMDTAQRGMGLDWAATRELIRRSGAEARSVGGLLACGAGTDHLPPGAYGLTAIEDAYKTQIEVVRDSGANVILMASRALAANAASADDYHRVYGTVLAAVDQPVILHWLGDMFDPALAGYWGSTDLGRAAESVLALMHRHADRIDGIKVSLLDADREAAIRAALPAGVKLYTGDDFNYPRLIESGSHALLGIFDAIAAPAAAALREPARVREILDPTVPLARHIFQSPTYHYKTGIVFLAWLNGHQDHFRMVGGQEHSRDLAHLVELHRLAAECGALRDPDLAAARLAALARSAPAAATSAGHR